MPSLKIPKDLQILKSCELQPKTRYKIAQECGNHYPTTLAIVARLMKMGYLAVSSTEKYRTGKQKTLLLTTSKGRAILRGHEEAERRG